MYNLVCGVISVYTSAGFIYAQATMESDLHAYSQEPLLKPFMVLYWQTKIMELMDTAFMILRHRSRQVTFLHVYHHATMLLLTDYTCHNTVWPAICFMYCINSIVHVILYFYYAFTAWYPNYNIPWKHRLTQIQLTQFAIDFVFAFVGYLYYGYCVYILIYLFTMTALFSNFYIKAYLSRGARAKKAAAAAAVAAANATENKNGADQSSENGAAAAVNGFYKESSRPNGLVRREINGNVKQEK